MNTLSMAGVALAVALPLALTALDARAQIADPGTAAAAADLRALRQQLDALRNDYEARLQSLEARLRAAEAVRGAAPTPAAVTTAPALPAVAAPLPLPRPATASSNAFNPAISLILSGQYARSSRDPAGYAIRGFALPPDAEVGPGSRGFGLGESELSISASVDPFWRGAAHIALGGDDSVAIEEAFVQTTALGYGLTLKAGRFFSGIGYLNEKHAHSWDFVDNPLAYQALLGTQYGDDGLQVKWLAPTESYVEFGVEVGRGRGFPGSGASRNGAGMWALTAHTGGDIGDSQNWRTGLSLLSAKASGQELADIDATGTEVVNGFSGRTRVLVADAVWKWAPGGNATRSSLTLQGEYLRSRRSGSLVYDLGGTESEGAYRATQSGWYLQGVWQFMPRWRVGLRTEQLDAGTPDFGANTGLLGGAAFKPRKHSLLVDFRQSEFSRLRLQLAQDRAREGGSDTQLILQYQMSLGAHGAHGY